MSTSDDYDDDRRKDATSDEASAVETTMALDDTASTTNKKKTKKKAPPVVQVTVVTNDDNSPVDVVENGEAVSLAKAVEEQQQGDDEPSPSPLIDDDAARASKDTTAPAAASAVVVEEEMKLSANEAIDMAEAVTPAESKKPQVERVAEPGEDAANAVDEVVAKQQEEPQDAMVDNHSAMSSEDEEQGQEAIEQTEESFREETSSKTSASGSSRRKLLERIFSSKSKKQQQPPSDAVMDDMASATDAAAITDRAVVNEDDKNEMPTGSEDDDDNHDDAPALRHDLSRELGELTIDDDDDFDLAQDADEATDAIAGDDNGDQASNASSTRSIGACSRPEIYSVHYKPSAAEQAAIASLELQIGVTEPKTWKLYSKPRVADSLKQAWKNMVYSGKTFATSSILLKQGPVALLSTESGAAASIAPAPVDDAVEVAEHGGNVLDPEPPATTDSAFLVGAPKKEDKVMMLYLFTHGMALTTVTKTADSTELLTLCQVVEWTQIHHVTPLMALNAICINLRPPINTSITLTMSPEHLQPWLDAFQTVLVQNTLHSSRPHSDIGWQYSLVHVSWFTLAVCGYEDDGLVRNRDLLNHLDAYNHFAPLHYAIRRANSVVVRELLQAGADPNLPNGDGRQSPVSMAQDVDDDEILQLLLEFGAKPEARKDKTELFGRVAATQDAIRDKKETKARDEARAAEVERIKTERVQAQMADNIRLMQERGEQLDEMGDKATTMVDGASEFSSLAKQLKEKAKQQAQPFSNPFSNPFKRGNKGGGK